MPVTRPEDMAQSFAEAFNSGNVDAVLALYESNAVLVAPPGQLASGIDAIREALQGFLVLKGKLAIESRYCIRAGDTALTSSKWSLRGTGPDGKPIEIGAKSAEVVGRQTDGRCFTSSITRSAPSDDPAAVENQKSEGAQVS